MKPNEITKTLNGAINAIFNRTKAALAFLTLSSLVLSMTAVSLARTLSAAAPEPAKVGRNTARLPDTG